MTQPTTAGEPVVRIQGLSKRYKVGRRVSAVPVPKIFGYAPPDTALKGRREAVDEDEEEEDDEEEEEEEAERHAGREVWALRDVTFDVLPGAAVGIIGANGSGKSTLLKVLCRITPPTEGRVELRGRVAPLLELASGFMQPEMTGPENVRLLARLFDIPREVVDRRMDEILAFAELTGFERSQLKRYSSGMARRLAFSVAVNLEPDLLLSDGILGVGDANFRLRCLQRMRELNERGLAVLFASHDPDAIRELCTEVLWLQDGAVRRHGPIEDVLAEYEVFHGLRRPVSAPVATLTARADARTLRARTKLHVAREKERETEANDFAVLLGARIVASDGEAVHALARDESATIEVQAELLVAAPIIVKLVLYGEGGLTRRLRGPLDWRTEQPGRLTARVDLPPGCLPGGRYTATAAVWVTVDGQRSRVVRPAAFTFDVDETDDDEQPPPEPEGWVAGAHSWRLEVA
jgi:ABC-type polysaccharide/polyol phosphate transport system ATPase subunit